MRFIIKSLNKRIISTIPIVIFSSLFIVFTSNHFLSQKLLFWLKGKIVYAQTTPPPPPLVTVCPTGIAGQNSCNYIGADGIQQAVDNSPVGNANAKTLILIKSGSYTRTAYSTFSESSGRKQKCFVDTKNKFVILQGQTQTVLNSATPMSGVCASGGEVEAADLTLKGFLSDPSSCFSQTTTPCSNGYGIYLDGTSTGFLNNNLILKNTDSGVKVTATAKAAIINNSIFATQLNKVNQQGNGIYCLGQSKCILVNNIVTTNQTIGINLAAVTNLLLLKNNLAWGNASNWGILTLAQWNFNGNISLDPQFVDTVNNNFHLKSTSPAVNSGDPGIKDADATISDMGAYGGGKACVLDPLLPGCQTPACPYSSTQVRLRPKGTTTWMQSVSVPLGQSVEIAGFHNGTNVPAGSTGNTYTPNVADVDFLLNAVNGPAQLVLTPPYPTNFTPATAGTFSFIGLTRIKPTDAQAGYHYDAACTNSAAVYVKSDPNLASPSACPVPQCNVPVGCTIRGGNTCDVTTYCQAICPVPTPTPLPPPYKQTVLYPVADARVEKNNPATNYGTSGTLRIDIEPVETSYLKFDLTSLLGKTVISATLRLKVTNPSRVNHTQNVKIVTNTTWGEKTITYNTRPALGTILATLHGGERYQWLDIDLTSGVKTQIGKLMSIGIDAVTDDGLDVASRDSVDKPQLLILYQ